MMNRQKKPLRARILAENSGFRYKTVSVPEWDNATVLLREPSTQAWLDWKALLVPDEKETCPSRDAQIAQQHLEADIRLFIHVVREENGDPVFTPQDKDALLKVYGPLHARLLHQALELSLSQDDAQKKSANPLPSSS